MKEFIVCSCGSLDHMLVVNKDAEDATVEVHLAPLPLWKRIRNAVKYVLGYRSRFGDYEEFFLSRESAGRLRECLDECLEDENFK
jgi:hypothetical protein